MCKLYRADQVLKEIHEKAILKNCFILQSVTQLAHMQEIVTDALDESVTIDMPFEFALSDIDQITKTARGFLIMCSNLQVFEINYGFGTTVCQKTNLIPSSLTEWKRSVLIKIKEKQNEQ